MKTEKITVDRMSSWDASTVRAAVAIAKVLATGCGTRHKQAIIAALYMLGSEALAKAFANTSV